jgi:hypothetical protein
MPSPSEPSKETTRAAALVAPSEPTKETTRATAASGLDASPTSPTKGTSWAQACASEPTRETTQVRALAETDPGKDPTRLMAAYLLEGGRCEPGCRCCGEGDAPRPFGLAPLPAARQAIRTRGRELNALLKLARGLIERLHLAHLEGSITPGDLELLHALQGWYSRLQAEQDTARSR